MKKKYIAVLCVLALVSALLGRVCTALAASRKTTYFMAVNDTVLELRDETMPFSSGGEIYVPYTVFDPNTTGIQLGVYASYGSNVAVFYGRTAGALIFDLAQDTATSSSGKPYTKRAIRHNSTVFVPIDLVVKFFGLNWSILVYPDRGLIVRVKGSSTQIPDASFISAGSHILESRYNAYLRENGLEPEPSPSPVLPSSLPARPSAEQPPATPQPVSPSAAPSESGPPRSEGGAVYVAVRCTPEGDTSALAAALGRRDVPGVFYFPADALADRDDEVRSLAAAGHKIGLLLDGETPEEQQAQAERGSSLLAHILRTGTDMALAEEGAALPEGWLAWPEAVDGTAGGRTAAQQLEETLEAAVRPEDTFLLLDDSTQTAGLASRLLDSMAEEGCTFRPGLEPVLASLP